MNCFSKDKNADELSVEELSEDQSCSPSTMLLSCLKSTLIRDLLDDTSSSSSKRSLSLSPSLNNINIGAQVNASLAPSANNKSLMNWEEKYEESLIYKNGNEKECCSRGIKRSWKEIADDCSQDRISLLESENNTCNVGFDELNEPEFKRNRINEYNNCH